MIVNADGHTFESDIALQHHRSLCHRLSQRVPHKAQKGVAYLLLRPARELGEGHHNFQDSVSSVGDVLQGHQIGSTALRSRWRHDVSDMSG